MSKPSTSVLTPLDDLNASQKSEQLESKPAMMPTVLASRLRHLTDELTWLAHAMPKKDRKFDLNSFAPAMPFGLRPNRSNPSSVNLGLAMIEIKRTALDERVLSCTFGHYPWDKWEQAAWKMGMPRKLASLGRLVMREAYQHAWDDRLKSLCGWYDNGRSMMKLALRSPKTAEKRWNRLLETDGYRGQYDSQTGEWVSYL